MFLLDRKRAAEGDVSVTESREAPLHTHVHVTAQLPWKMIFSLSVVLNRLTHREEYVNI